MILIYCYTIDVDSNSIRSFLIDKKIGLLLRTFATKESDVARRVELMQAVFDRIENLADDFSIFSRVDILIYADKRYPDADCGKTYKALVDSFDHRNTKNVVIEEVPFGDIFCGLGNYGFARQLQAGMNYTMTMSPEVHSYLHRDNLEPMIEALMNAARAVGLALNELQESVLEGRLSGTFMIWDLISLVTVGGLDLRASRPRDDREAHYMRGWHPAKGDVYYHLAGVEEMVPLARMVEEFGPCLAALLPQGMNDQRYEVPDRATQPELWERHVKKMGTKFERQSAHLMSIGYDTSWLKGGLMPAYRQ